MKVKVKDLSYLFLFIPYFLPGITQWTNIIPSDINAIIVTLNTIGNIWRLVSGALIIFLYLSRSKRYYSNYIIAVTMYTFLAVLSTLLKSGNLSLSLSTSFNRVTICMLFAMIIYERRFSAICAYFEFMLIINLIWMVFQPEGLGWISDGNLIYLMGHKNQFLVQFIFFLTILCIHKDGVHNRTVIFWLLICLVNEFLGGSSTGITVLVVYALLQLFSKKILNYIALHDRAIYIITIVAGVLLTLFYQAVVSLPVITWFIQSVLGKSLTLSYRTVMWTQTWSRIVLSPIIGFGYEINSEQAGLAHAAMLQIIYKTGFLGLAGFMALCVFAAYSKDKSQTKGNLYKWLCLGTLVILLDGYMEGIIANGYELYLMLLLQYATNHGAFSRERSIC